MVSPIFRHTNVDICWLYITWYSHSYPIESPCFMLNYGYITKYHILIDVECRLEVRISLLAKAWSKRCSAKRPPVALRPICRVRWTRGRGCPRGCPRYAAWAPGGRQLRKFNRGTGEPLIHWSSFMIFRCFCLSGTYLFHPFSSFVTLTCHCQEPSRVSLWGVHVSRNSAFQVCPTICPTFISWLVFENCWWVPLCSSSFCSAFSGAFSYCAQISPFLLVASPAAFHVISSVWWLAQSPWPGQKSIVMW